MEGRKKFDKAFKEQAVERILTCETTTSKIAKELGIHYSTVRDWVMAFEKDGSSAFPGSGNLKPEDDELRRLRKEVANLKEENEILKKAAAYFAKNLK
jgi:transposase